MSLSTTTVQRNIRRTPYQALAAIMVMFFTFLVLSCFLILAVGSEQVLKFYEQKPQALAFFKEGTTDSDVKIISDALNQTGKVKELKYVSKEDALNIYKDRNKDQPLLLELVTANILPSSLEISTFVPEDLKVVAEIVRREPVVDDVVLPEDVISQLTTATNLVRIVGSIIVGFLITFSTLIIMMIIGFKIRIRREEIEIMKLLGATPWFIRLPYLMEGIFYALIGAVVGWLVSFTALWYFSPIIKGAMEEVATVLFPVPLVFIVGSLLTGILIAVFVGGMGSMVAVRRYLRN